MTTLGNVRLTSRRASSDSFAASISRSNSQIEILYSLPDVRIVEFKPSSLNIKPVARNETASIESEPGTLHWASRFERTIAVGSLCIYRAPGSVAFLNCQNSIRPILPKSQAWCVDGESKFVLRSPPLFWRIEVPYTSKDEISRVDELKKVLDKILRYEKTPCPFRRSFTVELSPPIPIIRKPWKAVNHLNVCEKTNTSTSSRPDKHESGNDSCMNSGHALEVSPSISKPPGLSADSEDNILLEIKRENLLPNSPNVSSLLSEKNLRIHDILEYSRISTKESSYYSAGTKVHFKSTKENPNFIPTSLKSRIGIQPSKFGVHQLLKKHDLCNSHSMLNRTTRSFTSPPALSLSTINNSSKLWNVPRVSHSSVEEYRSENSSSASFHSLPSWHSPLNSSSGISGGSKDSDISRPSYTHNNLSLPVLKTRRRNDSTFTICSGSLKSWNFSPSFQKESQRSFSSDSSDVTSDDISSVNSNAINSGNSNLAVSKNPESSCDQSRKKLNGTCSSNNMFLSLDLRSKMFHMAHRLPASIIQKTFEIIFNPPSHIFQFMLRIAFRITCGEWRGVLSNYGDPIYWDFEEDYGDNEWFEDDYGNGLSSRDLVFSKASGSWGID